MRQDFNLAPPPPEAQLEMQDKKVTPDQYRSWAMNAVYIFGPVSIGTGLGMLLLPLGVPEIIEKAVGPAIDMAFLTKIVNGTAGAAAGGAAVPILRVLGVLFDSKIRQDLAPPYQEPPKIK